MPETTITTNENKALLDAAANFARVDVLSLENKGEILDPTLPPNVSILAVPTGRKIESIKKLLDEYRTRPERKKGTSEMATIESFVDQVNRSKDDDTVIFADVASRTDPKLIAVFDYNKAGPKGEARFGEHRARYKFPLSEEWKAWTAKPLENIDQTTFAEFLEARIMDVLDPSSLDPEGKGTLEAFCRQLGIKLGTPQGLMELSRGLTVHADHKVTQAVNVGTGEATIQFMETHSDAAGMPVKVVGGFAIAIPVFLGGAPYQIPVRLRYRVKDGQVKWTLQPQRLALVWDDAIKEAVNSVITKTDLKTLYGTPETTT